MKVGDLVRYSKEHLFYLRVRWCGDFSAIFKNDMGIVLKKKDDLIEVLWCRFGRIDLQSKKDLEVISE